MPDFTLPELTVAATFQPTDRFYLVRGLTQDFATEFQFLQQAFAPTWGAITGALTDNAALTAALAGKAAVIHTHDDRYFTEAEVTALLAAKQPLDADLTAIAALATQGFGRSLLLSTDEADARLRIDAPHLSGPNTFTGPQEITAASGPVLIVEHSGTADAILFVRAVDIGYVGNLVQVNDAVNGTVFTINNEGKVALFSTLETPGAIFPPAALTPAAIVDLAFDSSQLRILDLNSDVEFTTSNLLPGSSQTVKITCDGTPRNFTFPAWKFVGSAAPASIAASKVAILTITSFGTTDAECVAAYAVEP